MRKNLLLFGMLFIPILYFAQVSKQQAINLVMEKVVGSNSTNVNVYMEPVLQMDFYYKMSHYDSIASPYSNYWLFFIDDMPGYGWGHDCRYVFVNSDCGIISITNSHIPPYHRKLYLEIVSEPVTFVIPPINIDTTKQTLVNYDYPSNNGKYALLFTGGEIFGDNHTAFWNALCHSYCGLLENGFKKENVFVLSCDGGMANRSLDFDQDGQPDIMSDTCNLHGIVLVLDSLSSIMQEEDILYIYGAMHGDTVGDNTYLCLWDGGRWYDYQLANMLSRIRCSQYIVNIYSCYSGGMAEEIIAIPNDTYYSYIIRNDYLGFWKHRRINVSPSFMELFNNMVAFDYSQRPSISEIKQSKWMQEINWELLPKLKQEFIKREEIKKNIINTKKKLLQTFNNNNNNNNNNQNNNNKIKNADEMILKIREEKKIEVINDIKKQLFFMNNTKDKNNIVKKGSTEDIDHNINFNNINKNNELKGFIKIKINNYKNINSLIIVLRQFLKNEGYNISKKDLDNLFIEISNGEIDVLLSFEKMFKDIKISFKIINGNKEDFINFKKIMKKFSLKQ